jgi:hypothetical protein
MQNKGPCALLSAQRAVIVEVIIGGAFVSPAAGSATAALLRPATLLRYLRPPRRRGQLPQDRDRGVVHQCPSRLHPANHNPTR